MRSTGGYLPCYWPAGRRVGNDWQGGEHISCLRGRREPMEAGGEKKGARQGGGEPGLGGINTVWQAGQDKHTHTHTHSAFRAGCSAEHTQYNACFRTRGKREKIDKREAKSQRRNVCLTEAEWAMRERDYEPQVLPRRERNSHWGLNVNSKRLPWLSPIVSLSSTSQLTERSLLFKSCWKQIHIWLC